MRVNRFASDELLVDRVRAGSADAFEVLFDRHHRQLLTFCRHMLGSAADAEDAVQHTFAAAYADLMRSGRPIALRPWLYTIARNRCLSMLRARRDRPLAELPEPAVDHLGAAVDAREELRATLADVAQLPEDQRAALVLAELGDASHAEIAKILGCRHDKVKALVFQARSALATGRTARETPCAEIREQLAAGGLSLRRTWLRHHVRDCRGCREFGEQLRQQRRRLRILLPVAPGLGFKRAMLAAFGSSGGGGAVAGVTTAAGLGGLAASVIVSVSIAGGGGPQAKASAPPPDPVRPAVMATARGAAPRERPVRVAAPARRPRAARQRSPRDGVTAPRRSPAPVTQSPERRAAAVDVPQPPSAGEAARAATNPPPPEPAGGAETAAPADPPGKAPSEPPGRGRPPEPPGKPPETPGGGRPPEPPGKPPETPGGGRPPEPPGKPPETPGGGKPAEPPGPPSGDPGQPTPNDRAPAPPRR